MAHNLTASDSMFSVGVTPWHGLGSVLKSAPLTAADALREAGLDWEVRKDPASIIVNGEPMRIPGGFATVRVMKDGSVEPLAQVGADYKPVQNAAALNLLDTAVADGRASWETAGSLKGGRIVWGLVKLNAAFDVTGKGDEIMTYGLVSNSHDGSRVADVRFTPIRVVCWNTLSAAVPEKGKVGTITDESGRTIGVRARHTTNVLEKLDAGAQRMGFLREQIAATAENFRALAGYKLTSAKLTDYLKAVIPDNAKAESNTRTENIRKRILELVEGGRGADLPGVRGTLWGAYNAVTEYVDHERAIPAENLASGKLTAQQANARLESVWFGSGAALKLSAMNSALAMIGR